MQAATKCCPLSPLSSVLVRLRVSTKLISFPSHLPCALLCYASCWTSVLEAWPDALAFCTNLHPHHG